MGNATQIMTRCPECSEVRFRIGVAVWPDNPDSIRVCSTRCVRSFRKAAREDADQEKYETFMQAAELERMTQEED